MATRAVEYLQNATIKIFTVPAASTATKGYGAKFGAGDGLALNAGAGEMGFGVFVEDGAAGAKVGVALHSSNVAKVKVGTGGATRGAWAIMAADGFTDRSVGGGTTARHVYGIFMQSGVVGDEVGLMIIPSAAVSA